MAVEGIYTYSISSNKATITSVNASASGAIDVPATLGGYPVVALGNKAFDSKVNVTGITIPDSVLTLGEYVFQKCSNLISVSLPNSITSMGKGAFDGCPLLTSVNIPNKLTTIPTITFRSCYALPTVIIPSSIVTIASSAFDYCGLTSITIPSNVKTIESYAFSRCNNLVSIVIPNSVENLDVGILSSCVALTNVTLPTTIDTLPKYFFQSSTALKGITIPANIKTIKEGAFKYCEGLEYINISNVETIEKEVFYGCNSLIGIDLPDSLTGIPEGCFFACSSLGGIPVTPNLRKIGYNSFNYCTGFVNLVIPEGIEEIDGSAFYNCNNLETVSLPDSLKKIGASSFGWCEKLDNITIPVNVEEISYSFYGSDNLKSITFLNEMTYIFNNPMTMPATTKIYGFDPSTAKTYAEDFNRQFIALPPREVLTVEILELPNKLNYRCEEILNLTGIEIGVVYEDSPDSTRIIRDIPASLISGYDKNSPLPEQTLIVTIGGKTASFVINFTPAHAYEYGIGTANDPYQVWTVADLNGVRDNLSAHYKQMADIDLNMQGDFQPIGYFEEFEESQDTKILGIFTGSYDGNNFFIDNLTIANRFYSGLFYCISNAFLSRITLKNIDIAGTHVGAFAYMATESDILYCRVNGGLLMNIDNNSSCAGFINTISKTTIENSSSECSIIGSSEITNHNVAGFVYHIWATSTVIRNCYTRYSISGGKGGASGFLSYIDGSGLFISNCYTSGTISTSYSSRRPFSSFVSNIYDCFYNSDLANPSELWGNSGEPKTTAEMKDRDTYHTEDSSGHEWDFDYIWSIDGIENDGYPFIDISKKLFQNGYGTELAPYEIWDGEDLNNIRLFPVAYYRQMADIDLSEFGNWIPIATSLGEESFRGIYNGNYKKIKSLSSKGNDFSSLFGVIYLGSVMNLGIVDCEIEGSGAAASLASILIGSVENCFCTGTVTTTNLDFSSAGGLIGMVMYAAKIKNCFSRCNVINPSVGLDEADYPPPAGGLVGAAESVNGTESFIENCFSVGKIENENDESKGGLIGILSGTAPIESSYYNKNTSKCNDSGKGVGKSDAEMKMGTTFIDWDFEGIWNIDETINKGFPYIRLFDMPEEMAETLVNRLVITRYIFSSDNI